MWIKLEKEHRHELVLKLAETRHEVKLTALRNKIVQPDRTIPNNKPDIIIRNNEEGTYMLIDVAISGDRNVIKKESENILKYTMLQQKHSACRM